LSTFTVTGSTLIDPAAALPAINRPALCRARVDRRRARAVPMGPDHPRVGIVSFVVAGLPAREVAERLSAEYGIGLRDGAFCAHPFVRHLLGRDGQGDAGLADCPNGTARAIRASIGIGTTQVGPRLGSTLSGD
jgi:hypothetical protein